MASRRVEHLIVGAGTAGAAAARTLRDAGAEVLLVGRELDPPYHRPPISKGSCAGTESREEDASSTASTASSCSRARA